MNDRERIRASFAERQPLLDEVRDIFKAAKDEDRDLTAAEAARADEIHNVALPEVDARIFGAVAEVYIGGADAEGDLKARLGNEGYDDCGGADAMEFAIRCNEKMAKHKAACVALGIPFDADDYHPDGRPKRGVQPQTADYRHDFEDSMNGQPPDSARRGPTGGAFKNSAGETVRAYAAGDRMTDPEPGRIGAALQDVLRGRGVRNEVVTHSDTDGGFVVSGPDSVRLLDLVRAASVATRAGAQTLPMNAGGMTFGTIESDPAAQWRPEGAEVKASDITFGRIDLRPKTLAAIVPATIEWAEDATNGAALIESALSAALAAELDRAVLLGDGSDAEPLGLLNHPSVPTTEGVGTPAGFAPVVSAVGSILQRNYPGSAADLAWVRHPRDAETYANLTATDGQPLMAPKWAADLSTYHTTKLPADGGDGGNEGVAVVGDFREIVVGVRTSIQIRVSRDARVTDLAGNVHNAASELKLAFVAYLRADVAVLRPQFFQKLTGITAAA